MASTVSGPATGLRRTVCDNGLTVLSEHLPGVRSVALGAWVRSASIHEPSPQMGVSHFLEHLVFKGTRSMGPNRAVQYAGADYWQGANEEVVLLANGERFTRHRALPRAPSRRSRGSSLVPR